MRRPTSLIAVALGTMVVAAGLPSAGCTARYAASCRHEPMSAPGATDLRPVRIYQLRVPGRNS
jgi:hypothetical protein